MHPEYVVGALQRGEPWLDPRVAGHVAALAGPDGLAIPGVKPTGLPWQEPDGGFEPGQSWGRTDLYEAVDTTGRTEDRRTDFSAVYGDWDEVASRRWSSSRRGTSAAYRDPPQPDARPSPLPRPIRATCPTSTR